MILRALPDMLAGAVAKKRRIFNKWAGGSDSRATDSARELTTGISAKQGVRQAAQNSSSITLPSNEGQSAFAPVTYCIIGAT